MISILIIDERQDFQKRISNFFSNKGDIHVSFAGSVDEALKKSEIEVFDVILAKAGLSGDSALKLIETLRSLDIDTPFIIYADSESGYLSTEALREYSDHIIENNVNEQTMLLEIQLIVKSIVKRKRVEKSLRRREMDFRNIVSKNFDAMIVLDEYGSVKYANPSAEGLFRLSDTELSGKLFGFPIIMSEPVDMYILREFKSFVAVEMRMVEVEWEGKPSYLISLRDITEHILYENSLKKSRDEMEERVKERTFELTESNSLLQREITERQRMESQLSESERKYRRLVDIAHEGIWLLNERALTTFVNPRMAELLGYTQEEMAGKPVFHFTGVENHVKLRETLKKARQGVKYTSDMTFKRKDGSVISTLINISPIIKGGKYEGVVIMVSDITQMKRDEAELLEAKTQAELYLDLMGHDINNMNQIGLGYIELALQSSDIEEIKSLLLRPLEVMKNTSQIIDNVRKLKKLKTENILIDTIDLCEVLSKITEQYSHVHGRDIKINYKYCQGCTVKANGLIMDVFSNIVGNSIKHSDPNKPLTININVSKVRENEKPYYVCSIEDNGPGIPGWVKDKIFMRFQRGDTKAHGKGLGLNIVKVLVEQFNGKIWVEDRVPGDSSKGAKFVIALPAME